MEQAVTKPELRAIDGFANIFLEEYGAKLDDEGKRLLRVAGDNALPRNDGKYVRTACGNRFIKPCWMPSTTMPLTDSKIKAPASSPHLFLLASSGLLVVAMNRQRWLIWNMKE